MRIRADEKLTWFYQTWYKHKAFQLQRNNRFLSMLPFPHTSYSGLQTPCRYLQGSRVFHTQKIMTCNYSHIIQYQLVALYYLLLLVLQTVLAWLNRQINTIRQSITQLLFYIQRYICQGDMFRPSRSSSGPPRKQIQ